MLVNFLCLVNAIVVLLVEVLRASAPGPYHTDFYENHKIIIKVDLYLTLGLVAKYFIPILHNDSLYFVVTR